MNVDSPQRDRCAQCTKLVHCMGQIRFQDAELAVLSTCHQRRPATSDDIGTEAKVNVCQPAQSRRTRRNQIEFFDCIDIDPSTPVLQSQIDKLHGLCHAIDVDLIRGKACGDGLPVLGHTVDFSMKSLSPDHRHHCGRRTGFHGVRGRCGRGTFRNEALKPRGEFEQGRLGVYVQGGTILPHPLLDRRWTDPGIDRAEPRFCQDAIAAIVGERTVIKFRHVGMHSRLGI